MKPIDPMNYHFSGYNYDTEQKILKHGSQIVELTKKNHTLITYLLSHPKQLISREELIDHVWQGRVVTNNTIDQCILKLRKALNEFHADDYIESVYGQGIRFLPIIKLQKTETTTAPKRNNQFAWMGFSVLALAIIVGYWLLPKHDYDAIEALNNTITSQQNSQAALPIKSSKDDWLLYGGSSYLGYLLHLHPHVDLQKIHRNKAEKDLKPNLVLDLLRKDQSKQTLKIILKQLPANEINSYQAHLNLKDKAENIANIQINASQLTDLFPQIAKWVAQLDVSEASEHIVDQHSVDQHIFTQHESAMQNYFLGLTEQIMGDSQVALKYFNTAIDLDPDFKVAWYEMAIATSKQGDAKKAISILNAIDSKDQWMTYRMAIAKAINYGILKDINAAIKSYEVALQIAEADKDTFKMTVVYTNQAMLYSNLKQYEQAEQLLLKAIKHTDMVSNPNLYGSIMHSYTKVANHMNNLPLAIEKSKSAIEAYQLSGNLRYQMHSKTRLAGLLFDSNEFNQAELLVKESLSYANQLNNRASVSGNRNKLAMIYQSTGRFNLALEQWLAVIALNTELNNLEYNTQVYHWLMSLHLTAHNANQATIILDLMQQLVNENPESDWQLELNEVSLMFALYQQDSKTARQLIEQMASSSLEKLLVYQADFARLIGDKTLAETHYLDAAEILTKQGIPYQLTEVLNRLSDLYLTYDTHKLAGNLNRTSRLKPFIYPYQKYQAQAAKAAGNHIKALSMMEELKLKAGDFWQYQDQLLLESMQESQQ